MKNRLPGLILVLLLVPIFAFGQKAIQTYRNPVIAGDFPDPTVIRVGEDYYAAGTTSDFYPSYPLYHSSDLVNWEQIGSVFDTLPEWVKGDCWAPELYYNNGMYYVYYTARQKKDNITCIGVATTTDIRKGFTDHGPLIVWGSEAIDAYVFKDDDGKLYITWKAYGLDPSRPIEILASELSADGLSLVGESFSLTRHDKAWHGQGDEGQCIVKYGDYYYHFYSVGGCCDSRCDYRVEVARAKSLRGEWEQYDQNPILYGGDLWRCSGHGTIVQVPDGRYFYLYHAYQAYDFVFVGRQGLLDELVFDDHTGWPYFRNGETPSMQAPVPFEGTVQKRKAVFYDDFKTPANRVKWLRDANGNPDLHFKGINPHSGNFVIETEVSNSAFKKGLCIYGNKDNQFFLTLSDGDLSLYKKTGRSEQVWSVSPDQSRLFIRIEGINARLFKFYWSVDGEKWNNVIEKDEAIDGSFLPQWGKGVRIGLAAEQEGDLENFPYFRLINK